MGDRSKGAGERRLERFGVGGSVCEVVRLGGVGVSLIFGYGVELGVDWLEDVPQPSGNLCEIKADDPV